MNGTKNDRFGIENICSDTIISSSGTLTCSIPTSYGNVSILSQLYSNDKLISTEIFTISPHPLGNFGGTYIIMILILIMTLPLMMITSTIGVIIGLVTGVIIGVMLLVIPSNSIIGTSSMVVWLIIAAFIIIWKIARRES